MVAIETDRLLIRNFQAGDSECLRKMIMQWESSEYAAYDHEWPTSEGEIRRITEWFASGDSFVAVCLKDMGGFIGFISLNRTENEESREFNLGYIFDSDYHSRGYATEGCRVVVDFAFAGLGAQRVITGTAAANYPSCRLLGRLGMVKTGESKGSFRKTPDGAPIEFVGWAFALSRDEWSKLGPASRNGS